MIAVPPPVGVQRHYEQVGACVRLQNLRRPALLEDRVAERPGNLLENGGTREETNIVRGQMGEQLRPEIVGHEPVAPRERRRALGPEFPGPDRQRGEVKPCRPALCMPGELRDLVVRQVQSRTAQQLAGLGFVHAEDVRPNLQRQTPRPRRCHRERWPASRREGHLRPLRDVSRECFDGVKGGRFIEPMQVVQDQNDLLAHIRQSRPQARDEGPLDRHTRPRQRVEHARVEPRHAVERRQPHRSAGRSDRCPRRRRIPTRTGAATERPIERGESSSPSPGRQTGERAEARASFPAG